MKAVPHAGHRFIELLLQTGGTEPKNETFVGVAAQGDRARIPCFCCSERSLATIRDRRCATVSAMAETLSLTVEALETLREEAERARPAECCGVLAGRDGRVSLVVPVPNTA